jgi:cobalt-zinc-cadmium resistance protein CzcA
MALSVVLALSVALLLSLTWVPALLSLVMDFRHVPARAPVLVRAVEWLYPKLLRALLPRPVAVACFAAGLVLVGAVVMRTRGVEFTPQLDEGDLVIQTTRQPDISLERSVQAALQLEAVLKQGIPEVESVVSRIGSPAVATDIMGLEQADVFVALAPKSRWRPGLLRDALVAQMQRLIDAKAPGAQPAFTQPIQMRFNELLGGAVADVAVSLYGDDLAELQRLANALARSFAGVPGAADVRVLSPPAIPLLTVKPRLLELAQLGLTGRDVLDAVQSVNVGLDIGETRDGAVRIPLRLRTLASPRAAELSRLSLPLPGGGLVPLGRVAEIAASNAPSLINRRNGLRRVIVGFNVRGADLASVVTAAQAQARREVPLPRGYHVEWGGQYESLQQASKRLALIVPGVLVIILGVLGLTFHSLRIALAVFTVVPVAAVGGVLALFARGLPISLPAAIGFIALSGIAVMNGVVWMARALELEAEGHDARSVAEGAALERARPVMMTALVAALGFVPMMLSQGIGAEVQRPLATVVVGGLLSSTLLTLIILPVLYPWLRGKREKAGSQ